MQLGLFQRNREKKAAGKTIWADNGDDWLLWMLVLDLSQRKRTVAGKFVHRARNHFQQRFDMACELIVSDLPQRDEHECCNALWHIVTWFSTYHALCLKIYLSSEGAILEMLSFPAPMPARQRCLTSPCKLNMVLWITLILSRFNQERVHSMKQCWVYHTLTTTHSVKCSNLSYMPLHSVKVESWKLPGQLYEHATTVSAGENTKNLWIEIRLSPILKHTLI